MYRLGGRDQRKWERLKTLCTGEEKIHKSHSLREQYKISQYNRGHMNYIDEVEDCNGLSGQTNLKPNFRKT